MPMELVLPNLGSVEVWMSLLTLTFLEIVLGIDNIVFISIVSSRLKEEKERNKAMYWGLVMALVLRVLLLFGIAAFIAMQATLFSIDLPWIQGAFSGQSLLLFAGGLFLMYKSTAEIHHKLEGDTAHLDAKDGKNYSLGKAITQIALLSLVFSFDSILTAIGMTSGLEGALLLMIAAVVISMVIMMLFAVPVGNFVNNHPTVQMLGMAFLLLIGFMLIAEGAHLAHLKVAGASIGSVPKGYLYFAIAFSLFVEFLNLRLRKRPQQPVKLHTITEKAAEEGVLSPSKK